MGNPQRQKHARIRRKDRPAIWGKTGMAIIDDLSQTEDKPMNRITLKWGTLKDWNVVEHSRAHRLIQQYHDTGNVCFSLITQKDTPEQKQILFSLVDEADEIWLDWSNKLVGREEAKQYLLDYGV